MVSFICDACGQTVKKNRVEKHYQSECPRCSVLSCIDCGKDFHGDDYAGHTSCISEAEKYQGKLYQPKEKANKGEMKQQEWIKKVQQASDDIQNPILRGYLNKIQEYSNVPRKKAKFINFCKNSIRVFDQSVLEKLWEAFNPAKNEAKSGSDIEKGEIQPVNNGSNNDNDTENNNDCGRNKKDKTAKKRKRETESKQNETVSNGNTTKDIEPFVKKKKKKSKNNMEKEKKNDDECNSEVENCENGQIDQVVGKFNWQKAIKAVLKDAGEDGVLLKKLRKKVIAEYYAHGTNHQATTKDECSALFKQKLDGYKKAKITKERVFFKK